MLDRLETIATGLDHPEGVAWGPDGRVYAGGEAGQVYAIGTDGEVEEIASTGGFMYGITVDGDGTVFACDFGRAEIARVTGRGEISTYSTGTPDHPIRVPNFTAFDEAGALYVTDSGAWGADDGLVFRVGVDGATDVWTDRVPGFPNGCCLSAEGDALLVVESSRRRVVRVPIGADGAAGAPETVVDLDGSQPDGIALAADGTMFVGLLPARPRLARHARRPTRDLARRPRRRRPEPARQRRVHRRRPRSPRDLEPRRLEHRGDRGRRSRTSASLTVARVNGRRRPGTTALTRPRRP